MMTPLKYQDDLVTESSRRPVNAWWVGAGLGKSLCSLRVAQNHRKAGRARALLILAPSNNIKGSWPEQLARWTPHWKVTSLIGRKEVAWGDLANHASDVYLLSYESVSSLRAFAEKHGPLHPDMIVMDEAHRLKSPGGVWHRDVRWLLSRKKAFPIRIAMTATPYEASLSDYWSIYRILDGGVRLGTAVGGFQRRYMMPHPIRRFAWTDPTGENLEAAIADISRRTADITTVLRSRDHLDLPNMKVVTHRLTMQPHEQEGYDTFRAEMYARMGIGSGEEIDVYSPNADALVGKLQQFTAGFCYGRDGLNQRRSARTNTLKLDMLREIVSDGEPTVVFVAFEEERDRMVVELGATPYSPSTQAAWDAGEVHLLVVHIKGGVGLNLQLGGARVVWTSLPWTSSALEQGNARVHRIGQTEETICHLLVVSDTVDEYALGAIARRERTGDRLLQPTQLTS